MEAFFPLLLFSVLTIKGVMADDSGEAGVDEYKLKHLSIIGLETRQISTYQENNTVYSSENAADGNTHGTIAITKLDVNPYWSVDLEGEHCIGKVILYNRADCCSERLTMAIVRAGLDRIPNRNERCGAHVTKYQAQQPGGVINVYCDPPLLAKFVSVVLQQKQHLQLVEVMVEEYPIQRCRRPRRRVSILQAATEQSSISDNIHPARLAADGYLTALYDRQGFASTGLDSDPWWRVTLPKKHCISKVTLYNRADCCSDRLRDAVVRAGTSPDLHSNAPCGSPITADQARHLGGVLEVYCGPPVKAEYVSVDIPGRGEHLHLREVEIEELNVEPCQSDERDLSIIGKPTEQSSSYHVSSSSDIAADGNRDSYRCTHTKHEVDPWWLVDLEAEHCISRILVLNRGDCCSERLTNALVRAGTNADIHANPQCGDVVTKNMAASHGGTIEFICDPPLVARFVSVDIPSDTPSFLQLCEVTVMELITEDACREPEPVVIEEPEPTAKEEPAANKRVLKKKVHVTTEKPVPKKVDVTTEKPVTKKEHTTTKKPRPKKKIDTDKQKYTAPHGMNP